MAVITMPRRTAESLRGSSDQPFPAGPWKGAIRETRTKPLPSKADGTPFSGYATADGEMLTVLLSDNTPLDGQQEVGKRVYFLDIPLRDGQLDIGTIAQDTATESWQLQKAQRTLFNLAIALGQVQEIGEDVVLNDGFVEALASGGFNGVEVGFSIYHRKSGSNVYAEIESFFAV